MQDKIYLMNNMRFVLDHIIIRNQQKVKNKHNTLAKLLDKVHQILNMCILCNNKHKVKDKDIL